MRTRLVLTLSGILLGTTNALAADWIDLMGTEWTVDFRTVRVSRADPIEWNIDGLVGDRIIFDVRRVGDRVVGTLSLNCVRDQYSMSMLGSHLLTDDEPTSNWPLAAQLSATYCPQIDTLPQIDAMPPIGT
jgi:hypothetical protein